MHHHHRRPPRLWMVTTGMTTVVVTIAMALLLWVPQVSTVPVVVTETIHVAKHDAAAHDSPSPAPAETAGNDNDIPKQPTPPGGTAAKTMSQHEQPNVPIPLNTTSATPETPTTDKFNNNDQKQHKDAVQEQLQKQEPPRKSFGSSAQVPRNPETSTSIPQPDPYDEFMTWCHRVLGIQTSLEVHTFYYYDYMAALTWSDGADPEDGDDDDHYVPQHNNQDPHTTAPHVQDFPMIPVRGLRATRDIDEGEIVISIPFQALLTVHTTIDQDPVLGRVMGPKARKAYGWTLESDDLYNNNNNNNHNQQQQNEHPSPNNDTKTQPTNEDDLDEGPDFFELPLLAMALLHHRKLGTASPMHHYMDILTTTPIHSMPFLWSKQQRRHQHIPGSVPNNHPPQQQGVGWHEMSQETRTVARSIRKEMKEMYHLVVDVLVRDHPELFGKEQPPEQQQQQEEDWAFSFDNFQWAFAMVNSRHWQLPIEQKQPLAPPHHQPPQASPVVSQPQLPTPMSSGVDGVPPAEMPTDAWVEKLEVEEEEEHRPPNNTNGDQSSQETVMTTYHSFLAPVADLLNFGPPCTRGRYNAETHTFDIIASCQFSKGQEVTFWYSDECEDIIIGNYGFTHPMVPKCPKADDYREMRDLWRRRAQTLQEELDNAYEDLDIIDSELQHVQRVLADCHCCDTVAASERYWRQQEEQRLLQQEEQRRMNEIEMHRDNHQEGQEQLHVKYLRKDDANPSQIRGGTMSSSSGNSSTSATNSGRRAGGAASNKREHRRSQRTDDDVERHGVRRKWMMSNAGRDRRSGL